MRFAQIPNLVSARILHKQALSNTLPYNLYFYESDVILEELQATYTYSIGMKFSSLTYGA